MPKIFKAYAPLLLLAIANIGYATDCHEKTYYSDRKVVTLTGTVQAVHFWGPPGFGENPKHDSTYTGFLLYLDCPVYVNLDKLDMKYVELPPGSTYAKLNVINVRIEDEDKLVTSYKAHNYRRVKIIGPLTQANAPSDQTLVVFWEADKTEWLSRKQVRPAPTEPLYYCTAEDRCTPGKEFYFGDLNTRIAWPTTLLDKK
jgi:hypothetical protein